jgi:hypothetical protein
MESYNSGISHEEKHFSRIRKTSLKRHHTKKKRFSFSRIRKVSTAIHCGFSSTLFISRKSPLNEVSLYVIILKLSIF